jgi:hypothetical protein
MKANPPAKFVVDGGMRLYADPKFQARLHDLHLSVRARYAEEFARAGFWRRLGLRWRMMREYRREEKKIIPSSRSLYASANSVGD